MPSERAALLDRAGEMASEGRRSGLGAPALRGVDRAARGSRATRMPPPACSGGSGGSTSSRGVATRRWHGWSARSTSSRPTSPTRTSRCWRPVSSLGYWYSGDLERAAERAELALDIAEAHAYPAALALALRAKVGRRSRAVGTSRRPRRCSSTASRSRSTTTSWTRRAPATSSSPTGASIATSTPRRSPTSTRRSPSRGSSGTGRRSGPCSPSGPTRCPCWAAGTRRRQRAHEFTQEQIDAGGVVLSLLQSARRDPHPARRARRGTPHLLDVLPARGVHRRPGALRATWQREPRCAARKADRRRRSPTARRPSRWAAPSASPRRPSSRASSRRSRRRSRWASRRRSRSCWLSIETVPAGSRPPYLDAQAQALPRPPRRGRGRVRGRRRALPRARDRLLARRHAARARRVAARRRAGPSEAEPLLAEAGEIFERLEARALARAPRGDASRAAARLGLTQV